MLQAIKGSDISAGALLRGSPGSSAGLGGVLGAMAAVLNGGASARGLGMQALAIMPDIQARSRICSFSAT